MTNQVPHSASAGAQWYVAGEPTDQPVEAIRRRLTELGTSRRTFDIRHASDGNTNSAIGRCTMPLGGAGRCLLTITDGTLPGEVHQVELDGTGDEAPELRIVAAIGAELARRIQVSTDPGTSGNNTDIPGIGETVGDALRAASRQGPPRTITVTQRDGDGDGYRMTAVDDGAGPTVHVERTGTGDGTMFEAARRACEQALDVGAITYRVNLTNGNEDPPE